MSLIHDALEKGNALLDSWSHDPARMPWKRNTSAYLRRWGDTHRAVLKNWVLGVFFTVVCFLSLVWCAKIFARMESTSLRSQGSVSSPLRKGIFGVSRGFVLNGFISGDPAMALINNQLVGVGDRVGAAWVKSIEEKRVILQHRKKEIILALAA